MSFNIENLIIKEEEEVENIPVAQDVNLSDDLTETHQSEIVKVEASTPPPAAHMPTENPKFLANEFSADTKLALLKLFYFYLPESPQFSPFIDESVGFTWTVGFPVDPSVPHVPNASFKYDFLQNVTFELDSTITVPFIAVNSEPAVPMSDYIPAEMLPLFGGAVLN